MQINSEITTKSNPILYFNFTFKRFDINKILYRIYHKIAFAKRVLYHLIQYGFFDAAYRFTAIFTADFILDFTVYYSIHITVI